METTQQPGLSLVAERVADGRARILAEIRKVIVGQDALASLRDPLRHRRDIRRRSLHQCVSE